jgi:hypothetical protein
MDFKSAFLAFLINTASNTTNDIFSIDFPLINHLSQLAQARTDKDTGFMKINAARWAAG